MRTLPVNNWNFFYASYKNIIPSQFAVAIYPDLRMDDQIIEFGCGNGRDSLFFLNQGINYFGIDKSEKAIELIIKDHPNFSANFSASDILDDDLWIKISNLKRISNQRFVFYSRFFQHSINEEEEIFQIKKITSFLKSGDLLFFEFRLKKDKNSFKNFGDHFRRYESSDHFMKKFDKDKYTLIYHYEGRGVAKYLDEDPYVGRFIFSAL